jgi:DNA-binding NarL/FixJ family response regulator
MTRLQRIRLLIVDDHPVVRAGLQQVEELDPALQVVAEAASGAEAIAEAIRVQPDVVLLDYRLPDLSGDEVCRRLKAAVPNVRVLFVSSYAGAATINTALDAGADGYLLKANDAQKIADGLRTVWQGGMVIDPSIARIAVGRGQPQTEPKASPLDLLTEQERRVLAELATGKADKEIALGLGLEPKTVRNYVTHVFRKLGVHSRTQAALLHARLTRPDDPAPDAARGPLA